MRVATEAARAINDLPVAEAMPALAALAAKWQPTEEALAAAAEEASSNPAAAEEATGDAGLMPLLRRVINANLRVGTAECAAALAAMAANPALPPAARLEAVEALAEFPNPEPRDRVIGHWRPVDAGGRAMDAYLTVLKQRVPSLAVNAPSAVRTVARELAAKHAVPMDSGAALAAVLDRTKPAAERVACLVQLAGDRDAKLKLAIDAALTSDEPRLRAQARTIVARQDPGLGVAMLAEALAKGTVPERQAALAALAALETPAADKVLAAQAEELEKGTIAAEIALDVYEAAAARPDLAEAPARIRAGAEKRSSAGLFALALQGGDADRGRQVVNFHSAAACLRCHQVEGTGGHAAPSLAGVAARYDRQGLLDSLIAPNAKVAEGFGPVSSMPAMGTMLTPREVRDVVEYLATLR
jgi:quinoprotein glucose dehydrogenase